MSDGFRLSAASYSAHAIDYHLRELYAMKKWIDASAIEIDCDALLAGLLAAVRNESIDEALSGLTRFPWFAFLVQFLATRIDVDSDVVSVRRLATTSALRDALPPSVRAKEFGVVVDRLVTRVSCRLPSSMADVDSRADELFATLRAALNGDCVKLIAVSYEFVGLVVHAYERIADELRWLTLPAVPRRELVFGAAVDGLAPCQGVELDSLYSMLVFLCSPKAVHTIADVAGGYHSTPFRNRLVVLLFDCIDHYVRVGGYEFVHRAVYELLTFAERADENRWPVLLHLCADLLCSPIVLLRSGALGKRIVVWPSVERYRAAPPVVTVEHAPSQWRIASLVPGATLPTLDALDILAPLPSSTELFETLRRGDRQLHGNVTVDDLLTLVGSGGWLTSSMVYSLVCLATRDVDDVAVFDPLMLDTQRVDNRVLEQEMARVKALDKATILVPWNNRSGHWTLLCIDVEQKRARYYDSLHETDTLHEQRTFCSQLLNDDSVGVQFVSPSPLQPDGQSCGVFVAMNAWFVSHKQPLPDIHVMEGCRLRFAKKWLLNELLL